jgi:hypothetical protein
MADQVTEDKSRITRRLFFGAAAGATAAAAADASPQTGNENERERRAFRIRVDTALLQRDASQPGHPTNGDEAQFATRIGNYSKGLPHNSLGEVDPNVYAAFQSALENGAQQSDLDQVQMGAASGTVQRKFVDPCAGVCFDLQGADSHHVAMPAAPGVLSAETAGEMVELYWQALLRDIPFTVYDTHPLAQAASVDLSKLSNFQGPKVNGAVTPATLFRGFTHGDTVGPYLSQFLARPVPFGAQAFEQRQRVPVTGLDYGTDYAEWLSIQNGSAPAKPIAYDSGRPLLRNGRDIGQWVHIDVLYQAYFNAMLIMMASPDPSDTVTGGGMGVPYNPGNPYQRSRTQEGFGTFGSPAIAAAVAEIATRALKGVWYQKWMVHRRLRPEAYGGLVHNTLTTAPGKYDLHKDVLNSDALQRVKQRYGTYLLPLAFPEGSPLHPSYGAGHATTAGACVTILKAFFDDSTPITNPVTVSPDGSTLVPYTGADAGQMTVGGELNKVAANVAIGRNFAGVHWRSDYAESLRLGEQIAISVLRDQRMTYVQDFEGYTFTRFDGSRITV